MKACLAFSLGWAILVYLAAACARYYLQFWPKYDSLDEAHLSVVLYPSLEHALRLSYGIFWWTAPCTFVFLLLFYTRLRPDSE
jgi:hypothetical protein